MQRGQWLPLLLSAHQTGVLLAGVCTGTMLLAHAGVIGTRRACTHRGAWPDLSATGATLVPERVVDDGDLVTSGGVTSGIDLSLWLLEREIGPDLADWVAPAGIPPGTTDDSRVFPGWNGKPPAQTPGVIGGAGVGPGCAW